MNMKIEELKKKHKDEWLAVEVTKEKEGIPLEGEVLDHDKDRRKLYDRLIGSDIQDVFTFYSGDIIEKGYAYIL